MKWPEQYQFQAEGYFNKRKPSHYLRDCNSSTYFSTRDSSPSAEFFPWKGTAAGLFVDDLVKEGIEANAGEGETGIDEEWMRR